MKKFKYTSQITLAILAVFAVMTVSCEREFSDDITLAKYPTTPEVFTDFPVGLTDQFFISFDPVSGANVNGFDVDNDSFKGTSAIRIDVPRTKDPDGGYIGGIFKDRGNGRDLTDYDALTFWAKGTTTANIDLFGFGLDFEGDNYSVGLEDTRLSTNWKKYVIPIPDPSKLVQEKGVFSFSACACSTLGNGYTFWIDEIRFEKLGNLAQLRPAIFNGNDEQVLLFMEAKYDISGTIQTISLGDGSDVTVSAAKAYFDYTSSDPYVAQVNEKGEVTVVGIGTAKITASLNGVEAAGSLTVEAYGSLPEVPSHDPANVISIFSDAYENVNIDFYNGYWQPWQTTTSADFDVNGDNILVYENFNFVGHQFSDPVVDATSMTHLHLDVLVPGEVPAGAKLKITIKDFGPDGKDSASDDKTQDFTINSADLTAKGWSSFDIPLTVTPRTKLGQFIFSDLDTGLLPSFYLDNVYFYKE
jgi:hypothetical protein